MENSAGVFFRGSHSFPCRKLELPLERRNDPKRFLSKGVTVADNIYLDTDERRVLGVLIEKSLTTPQYYPMTINAIVTGCNQKSNRDPVVEMVDDEVEEVLQRLRERDLTTVTYPAGGRTEKWRQEFTSQVDISGQQMAVIGELLLRGPQTLGELRARASRMKRINDLSELESVLDELGAKEPPLVQMLTPPGVKRGARVTHRLYPEAELAEILEAEESGAAAAAPAPSRSRGGADALKGELDALRARVEAIEAHLGLQQPNPPTE